MLLKVDKGRWDDVDIIQLSTCLLRLTISATDQCIRVPDSNSGSKVCVHVVRPVRSLNPEIVAGQVAVRTRENRI